nr:reverse transcriptase domain-containing protein [Tanacetum cinerariifolium]
MKSLVSLKDSRRHFGETWELFKEMLRACPHHGFTELAQIDTFYNGLNDNDQDSFNATAGGNLLSKTTREALQIIENKSKVGYLRNKPNVSRMNTTSKENASKTDDRIDKLADQISTLVDIFAKKVVNPGLVKAVEESCVTCGGPHAYYNCPNTVSNQPSVLRQNRFNQNQGQGSNFNQGNNFHGNQSFQVPNQGFQRQPFQVPNNPVQQGMDVCHALADLGTSINLMPLSISKNLSLPELTPTRMTLELADQSITRPKGVAEDVFIKVGKFHFLTDFVVVDFEADPRVPLILGRSFLRIVRALIDVYGEEITLRVTNKAVTFNFNQTTRYSSTYDDLSVNQIDIIDVAREEYAQEILGFSNNSLGGNPTSIFEPILSDSSPSLTPFEGCDFILEEIEAYLKDESISLEFDHADSDPEEDICVDKLPVIIAKDLKVDEKEALLKVLKSHKRAIAWEIIDIKGIDPRFCTHKILMEDDYKPAVQSKGRVNPKIHEVIKKEAIKLLDSEMIYPISNSPWVSPLHSVPKKGGITVVENKNNELIPTWLVTGWRVCIDYRKLNDATRKDHFPLPFMIGYFSKIARPMSHLLEKETPILFSKDCIDAFETLKKKLTEAPILVVPDWNLPFELMCDASDFAIGAVLGQLYAFEKFRPYLVFSKSIVYTDHSDLKYLLSKQDAKPRLIRWVLHLQEFDIIIRDKKGTENITAYHFSRLENPHKDVFENKDINENFLLETLGKISSGSTPWFADFVIFHAGNFIIKGMSSQYILVAVDYFSKWVKAKALPTNDARVVVKFLKSLFARFRTPRAIITDRGTYFCNDKFAKVMSMYGVTHHLATAYHPITSGQVEVSNQGLKHILERMVGENRTLWSEKLEDALWAFRTAYKIPIGCTPYKLVYGKSCHLPIELSHMAYWALKHVYFDLKTAGDHRKL